jgi:RimJ/RimL family protein N-acetyltransferase
MKSRNDVGAIQATIAEPNIASRKTAETAGFTLLGSADHNCNCGGEDISAVLYEMTLKPSLL